MNVQVLVAWRDPGCAHRRAAWEWCQRRWAALHPTWQIVTGTCGDGPWNPARAFNDALDKADADVVLISGADMAMSTATATAAVEAALTEPWVLVTDDMVRLPPAFTSELLNQSPSTVLDAPVGAERLRSHLGWGPLAGRLEALRAVRWDERFVGYGGEDDAFAIAARVLLGEPWRGPGSAFLLWHPPLERDPVEYAGNLELLARYVQALDDPGLLADVLGAERCSFSVSQGLCCLPVTHQRGHLVRGHVWWSTSPVTASTSEGATK